MPTTRPIPQVAIDAHAAAQHNPWSAPGSAPVADACGLAGGSPWEWNRAEAGNYVNTTHAKLADKGSSLKAAPSGTVWDAGTDVEVAWTQKAWRAWDLDLSIYS